MAKQNNPYDPVVLREGLDKEPLVPMNYKGPLFETSCSMFGQGCVEMFHDRFGLPSMNFLHVWPTIDRRGGEVTSVVTVASFDAASGNKDIWINGDRNSNANNNGVKMITNYKNVKTSGAKFGLSDAWKKVIGGIALNFDNDGKIVVDAASTEQIRRDGRFRNFAYVELDFFKLMALVLEIGSNDPYDFTIDFEQGRVKDGHEDCFMVVHKFVGKRKTNNFKYQKFDSNVMTEGLESMYGGNGGGGRRRR